MLHSLTRFCWFCSVLAFTPEEAASFKSASYHCLLMLAANVLPDCNAAILFQSLSVLPKMNNSVCGMRRAGITRVGA